MKKVKLNFVPDSNLFYTLSGAFVTMSSTFAVAHYLTRRECKRSAPTVELLLGLAGLGVGAFLLCEPDRKARKRVVVEELFDDKEADLTDRHIREVLGKSAERPAEPAPRRRTIEVDEETSIEDFENFA